MTDIEEDQILRSWRQNASAWTRAVRAKTIASRRQVTDRAILETIFAEPFATALDIGCGEGWLCRAMQAKDVEVIGIDAIPRLVDNARQLAPGDYRCMSYADLAGGKLDAHVDLAVCNFSLLGGKSVNDLLPAIPGLLNSGGRFIVQTLHPGIYTGNDSHDGWRAGSWAGFSDDFTDPAPWYFRTLESWLDLLTASGFKSVETREPKDPDTGQPASIIFVARTG
jgi:2-polyprenyl-3-methyl-5-hydroxy-6-metoxy-1,4-benzoquinol methylase